jgi:branched-chain amino acid transport system ATP-binding protein
MSTHAFLSVEGITVGYGGIIAVRRASIRVNEGEMVALIGTNGAGKTTLLNTLSGLLKPVAGRIALGAVNITGWPSHRVARSGLLQVPEGRRILSTLSVEENLALGRLALVGRGKPTKEDLERVYGLFPVLAERRRQEGGSLSGGQQQMLAIGRALMGRPRLLLLDEPSLGLAPIIVEQVFDALRRLREQGLTILLVEQNARLALAMVDRGYVIESGKIVHEGLAQDLVNDPQIEAHYLGHMGRAPPQPAETR